MVNIDTVTAFATTLQGLDEDDCVIYVGSLWKMLFQVLRVCYVVIPECLKFPLLLSKMQTERHLPVPEQLALTDLMNEGSDRTAHQEDRPLYAAPLSRWRFSTSALEKSCKSCRKVVRTHVVAD
ncbi:MAG: hypothetical protein U0105_27820 [Candidatus Obscuribacterales bacterium]